MQFLVETFRETSDHVFSPLHWKGLSRRKGSGNLEQRNQGKQPTLYSWHWAASSSHVRPLNLSTWRAGELNIFMAAFWKLGVYLKKKYRTPDMWHLTHDKWHVTCDIWWGVNSLCSFHGPSSYGLGVMIRLSKLITKVFVQQPTTGSVNYMNFLYVTV